MQSKTVMASNSNLLLLPPIEHLLLCHRPLAAKEKATGSNSPEIAESDLNESHTEFHLTALAKELRRIAPWRRGGINE